MMHEDRGPSGHLTGTGQSSMKVSAVIPIKKKKNTHPMTKLQTLVIIREQHGKTKEEETKKIQAKL